MPACGIVHQWRQRYAASAGSRSLTMRTRSCSQKSNCDPFSNRVGLPTLSLTFRSYQRRKGQPTRLKADGQHEELRSLLPDKTMHTGLRGSFTPNSPRGAWTPTFNY